LGRKAAIAFKSLQGAALVTLVDLALSLLATAAFAMDLVAAFGLALLLEGAGLMLLGGALSFGGQAGVRNLTGILTGTHHKVTKTDLDDLEAKAATFALIGILLFVESLALAAATV